MLIPNLDDWLTLQEQWQGKPQRYRLYANQKLESVLARAYLASVGCEFELVPSSADRLSVHNEKIPLPILVDLEHGCTHKSIIGVKNFVRGQLLYKRGIKSQPREEITSRWWDNYGVTCFDENDQKIYVGPIEKAPHPIKGPLDDYDYKDWYEVASWDIGNWQQLLESQREDGIIIHPKTKTVLLPDEVKFLEEKPDLLTLEIRNMYQVQIEKIFRSGDGLYRLHAYMLD